MLRESRHIVTGPDESMKVEHAIVTFAAYKFLQDNWGFVPNYVLALGTQPQSARPSESLYPCNVRRTCSS